jgi:hypothetical protein
MLAKQIKLIFYFAFSLFFINSLVALEIKEGLIKLILHKDFGRFSAYYLSNIDNFTYKSLLVENDPRTTVLTLVIDNRVYRMGETLAFKETIEQISNGARFVWSSSFLKVTEEFTFVSSKASQLADGIMIKLYLENISNREVTVGVRYIFDTYLGEDPGQHFMTNMETEIKTEKDYQRNGMIRYWVSPLSDNTNFKGLQVMTSGEGVTIPDSVVFANWKRLNDSTWSYVSASNRNFNLLPYSVNDSAVSQYYEPLAIATQKTREIVLVMGNFNKDGFSAIQDTRYDEIKDILEKATTSSTSTTTSPTTDSKNDSLLTLKGDLKTIDNLLLEINKKIDLEQITENDIIIIERIIREIKNKYNKE